MLWRRLFTRPNPDDALTAENARLRQRVNRLELDLVRRRTDDILSTRDHLLPMPRPGSGSAKLMMRNRALQKRLQAMILERVVIAQDLVDAANEARAAGHVKLAASLRQRADALSAPTATPTEVPLVDSDVLEDFGPTILASWDAVPDREDLVRAWWSRLVTLAGTTPIQGMPQGLRSLAHVLVLTLAGQPEPGDDRPPSVRAADFLRTYAKADLTADWYAVAAEATLYALADALGPGWTEEVRMAWCRAIDAVARALGLDGMSGTVLFSADGWSEGSRS